MNSLFSFGDSWCYGSELGKHDSTFTQHLGNYLGVNTYNFGKEGSSLGEIVQTVILNSTKITEDDFVVVIVPPDVRWYKKQDNQYTSITPWGHRNYYTFFGDQDVSWFSDHHKQFIYTIQSILSDIGCKFLMQHNYGTLIPHAQWDQLIDWANWLDPNLSLTEMLGGHAWNNFDDPSVSNPMHIAGPRDTAFVGKYFEGCQCHPNALGHEFIAKKLYSKIKELI